MSKNFFPKQDSFVQTSQGRVDLPILYYDTSVFYAFFDVPLDAARAILTGTGLQPIALPDGRAVAGIAAYEYRATTVGVYNEVGLALLTVPESVPVPLLSALDIFLPAGMRKLGFYITDLPVTTAAANAAGREIWGYPKFVTRIPLSWGDGRLQLQVMHPESADEAILTLAGNYSENVHLPNFDLTTWTNLAGELLKTHVTTRGKSGYCFKPDVTLSVGQRDHRMQRNLASLEMDGKKPIAMAVSHDFQSILPAGEIFSRVAERQWVPQVATAS